MKNALSTYQPVKPAPLPTAPTATATGGTPTVTTPKPVSPVAPVTPTPNTPNTNAGAVKPADISQEDWIAITICHIHLPRHIIEIFLVSNNQFIIT